MSAFTRLRGDIRGLVYGLIMMLPVLANAPALLGVVNADPALSISGLRVNITPALVADGAGDFLDGATGGVMQPLAELSANDWLNGIIPWWNPYTGVGMPLAAEMVGQAFFLPFIFFFKLKLGWIWFRVALEILSGLGMYALLNRLKLGQAACLSGAVLYELNSSFFMFPQGVGPLPFLPLLLLGIEHAAARAQQRRLFGGACVGFSVAYSIYAGFPEVAYIDGMLAGTWTVWRFCALRYDERYRFVTIITSQIVLGLAMAMPLLLPFHEYVSMSFLGAHADGFARSIVDPKTLLMLLLPYVYGPIGGSIGGYHVFAWLGLPACCLAITGAMISERHRSLGLILVAYVTFWLLRCFGFPPAIWAVNLIPMMARVNVIRFCWPSIAASVFILAALGVDSWLAHSPMRRSQMIKMLVIIGVMTSVAFAGGASTLVKWRMFHAPASLYVAMILSFFTIAATAIILWLRFKAPTPRALAILTGLVLVDAFASAFAPQLSTPCGGELDLAPVQYLQRNIGTGRMYSLSAFNQDYPASYGVAAINSYALPVTNEWVTYIHENLDPYASGVFFDGIDRGTPDQSPIIAFSKQINNYLDIGVKFIAVPAGLNPISQREALPVDDADGQLISLHSGDSSAGIIPAGIIALPAISSIDVALGTYYQNASGPLIVSICQGERCAEGQLDLSKAFDNKFNEIALDHALPIAPNLPVRYIFTHPTGRPVAIWLGMVPSQMRAGFSMGNGVPDLAPRMQFELSRNDIPEKLVFHDHLVDIYEVFDAKPFFSSTADCALTTIDFNHVIAHCSAAATLLRLEAWYPGWHVLVNGHAAELARSHAIFQSVILPPGENSVRFFYMPDGIRYAVAVAIAALLTWLGLLWRAKKMPS